ncbi:MAG: dTDP-4-dehydrorhamnose 3,5-epimerase [Bacteroidetes bacterium]|nr:dTDP-4-dehydrorhamnose 3,5-epimerase [Bacteroidota bacterium]
MEIIKTNLDGVLIIKPEVFADERGYFFESYNEEKYYSDGLTSIFVQDNESKSRKNVLRGLHFQVPPYEQGKLVRVMWGAALDVAVDLRKHSHTFGKWTGATLSRENKQMLWIPPGFAHGFVTLEDDTVFFYKCTNVYNKESERSILWNDPDLNVEWGVNDPVISEKDKLAMRFREFVSPF